MFVCTMKIPIMRFRFRYKELSETLSNVAESFLEAYC